MTCAVNVKYYKLLIHCFCVIRSVVYDFSMEENVFLFVNKNADLT